MHATGSALRLDAAQGSDNTAASLDQGFLLSLVGHSARLAFASVRSHFQRCVNEHGLSPGDFAILSLLQANPSISQRKLADALTVSPPNLAIVLDRLCARNLIERARNTTDKRSYTLHLTAEGAALYQQAEKTVAELEDNATAMLTSTEKQQLLRLLHKVAGKA